MDLVTSACCRKCALIRCDFSLHKRSFIPQAARLQLVLSALSGPRFLGIAALIHTLRSATALGQSLAVLLLGDAVRHVRPFYGSIA